MRPIVIDAGANCGFATLSILLRYPEASVIAIEPEPENFELLKKNTEGLEGVRLIEAALWCREEKLVLANPTGKAWDFQTIPSDGSADNSRLQVVTLHTIGSILNNVTVDLLKMDIEGAEKELFEDTESRLWIQENVNILMVELHERLKPGCIAALDLLAPPDRYHREHFGEYTTIWLKPNKPRVS